MEGNGDAARWTERSPAVRVPESRADDGIKLKTKWAALEALVGNPKRIDLVAADLVQHYERRLEAMEGKAMTGRTTGFIFLGVKNPKARPVKAELPLKRNRGDAAFTAAMCEGFGRTE